MQKAAFGALMLHLLLLALVPDIPHWQLPFAEQGFRLNVLLQKEDEEQFQQSLNYPTNETNDASSQTSSLYITSPMPGRDDSETDQSQEIAGTNNDSNNTQAVGLNSANKASPTVVFSRASILKFAREEAKRYADFKPKQLARFNRSFNSRRQYQRRKATNSYKNQYGDQYVKNSSSSGDICFVKTADKIVKPSGTFDASTYTVHFFRCKDKALNLEG